MSLQEALKGKALALISQQMANWVVEIQRHLGRHQEELIRALDDLQESVARYDEKIDEEAIGAAIAEVLAAQPPPSPAFDRLKSSLAAIEKGSSLSEVLTYLVNEVSQFVPRAAMFIIKGPSAIGWYARGFEPPDAIKQLSIPLTADTVFRTVHNSRQPVHLTLDQSPGSAQALGRLAGNARATLGVPLILRDKLAAILYCDAPTDRVPPGTADLVEVLALFASKIVDVLSATPKAAPGARTTSTGSTAERAEAIRTGGEEVRERAGVPRPPVVAAPPPPPPPPPPTPAVVADEGASTVMFNAGAMSAMRAQMPSPAAAPPRPAPAAAPTAPPATLAPEVQKQHEDAKRFARLVVSEIKLYNENKVTEGRRQKDLYERLKEDIERGRQMYTERVSRPIRETTNYFYDELVRILAGGDSSALGPM